MAVPAARRRPAPPPALGPRPQGQHGRPATVRPSQPIELCIHPLLGTVAGEALQPNHDRQTQPLRVWELVATINANDHGVQPASLQHILEHATGGLVAMLQHQHRASTALSTR